jgi:oxygen-independent coproporphyrinogen-3 oxidase
VFPQELEAEYLEALCAEIGATEWPWKPETVYLGGGTPGSMQPQDLKRVLAAVPGKPWLEATLEAAPGALKRADVESWRECGIGRVSLGVQSFVEGELRKTGRRHTAGGVAQDVALLRECGIDEINIDLIAGLPGQTAESWGESLVWIERLAPPHVSIYMLEIDEDSRLGHELLAGGSRYGARLVPHEDDVVTLYEEALERLETMGLRRYEISNFALPGHESRHNLKYWRLEPYLGFGADAHSFDGTRRFQNVESANEYVRAKSPRLGSTRTNRAEERFFVGLRLMDGIRPEPAEWTRFEAPIQRFLTEGLLAREGEKLRLTNRGVLLSNEVFAEFITT